MHLFHYHLVTSELRDVEGRYLVKLGFGLVARYGRIGDEHVAIEPGVSWEKLDHDGFKLRLSELQRGSVNVVVQPGHWRVPRVDHLGVALDEEDFQAVLRRAAESNLRVQEHGGRRTFVATNAGYRLEVHPPRDWIDELLGGGRRLPARRAAAARRRSGGEGRRARGAARPAARRHERRRRRHGRPLPARRPRGRPELYGERFV